MIVEIESLAPGGLPWPPIVFALYGREEDQLDIIDFLRIETVKARGEDDYYYHGIRKLGYYMKGGSGRWFSGTLVAGDDLELGDGDKGWMLSENRDEMEVRIKVNRIGPDQPVGYRVYVLDMIETTLHISR